MYMDFYITPQNETKLRSLQGSMSGFINFLIDVAFTDTEVQASHYDPAGIDFSLHVHPVKYGTPAKTATPQKIADVKTFLAKGQSAQAAVDDLLKKLLSATPNLDDTPMPFTNLSGVELPCCQNPDQPCRHWVWDVQTGEGYVNTLSRRKLEVE